MKLDKAARTARMISQFKAGMTLEQVGRRNGRLTRQRVQQILAGVGVSRYHGGRHAAYKKRCKERAARRVEKTTMARAERIIKNYHCTPAEYDAIMKGKPYTQGCIAYRYFKHKQAAANRRIGFDLTFPQWYTIWETSGHLQQRGRGRNNYVMARIGDVGAYTVGNVKIITSFENIKEGYVHRGYTVRTPEEGRLYRNAMARIYYRRYKARKQQGA